VVSNTNKVGFGGGCHWCTEAVFQGLQGVAKVEQGYIASIDDHSNFSEGVIVHYNPSQIPLHVLIEIHLHTHHSTKMHSRRTMYRSAIYVYNEELCSQANESLRVLQADFEEPLITQVLPLERFKSSRETLLNYYNTDPERPFCKRYIHPKLQMLQKEFSKYLNT